MLILIVTFLGKDLMAYYRSLTCGILIIIFLALGEVGLNTLRAILKGQSLFNDDKANEVRATENPDREIVFPFNSRPITVSNYNSLDLKLWVSSASHAADHHGIDNQFSNLLCRFLENKSCYVLNASKAGILLEDNITFLKHNVAEWHPDYVLLYQAYLDIHNSSKFNTNQTSEAKANNKKPRVAEKFKKILHVDKLLRSTVLRNYSRNYLGSLFLLATPLLNDMPATERESFKMRLLQFIKETRKAGTIPILTTLVSAYGDSHEPIDWRYKAWLMRYFEGYSPETISLLIRDYNALIRRVGSQNNVLVIDLERLWTNVGRKNQFDDFVHFTKSGHQQIARIIADELMEVIK